MYWIHSGRISSTWAYHLSTRIYFDISWWTRFPECSRSHPSPSWSHWELAHIIYIKDCSRITSSSNCILHCFSKLSSWLNALFLSEIVWYCFRMRFSFCCCDWSSDWLSFALFWGQTILLRDRRSGHLIVVSGWEVIGRSCFLDYW